jgi:dipeptidyl aminopeptidase/acylaminoacyl peptidase
VAIAGVYDFVARFTDQEQTSIQSNLDGKLNTNTDWIGAAFSATDEHWRRASAIHHVDATDPPLLLIHSKDDPIVPWMQSRNMYEKLREVGVAAEIEIGESGKHGGPENKKELMLAFFRQILIEPSAVINPQP